MTSETVLIDIFRGTNIEKFFFYLLLLVVEISSGINKKYFDNYEEPIRCIGVMRNHIRCYKSAYDLLFRV